MTSIYFTVLPDVPETDILENVEFLYGNCFMDWAAGYEVYPRNIGDKLPGHFAIVLDAFEYEHTPSHRAMLTSATEWMQERGFPIRLMKTKSCKMYRSPLKDNTPVMIVSYDPNDNRSKIYHALCWARQFTNEYTESMPVPRKRRLTDYMSWVYEVAVVGSGHMPFSDAFIRPMYFMPSHEGEKVHPVRDKYLGILYLAFLDEFYQNVHWDDVHTGKMGPYEDRFDSYWFGGLRYEPWAEFYRQHINNYKEQ